MKRVSIIFLILTVLGAVGGCATVTEQAMKMDPKMEKGLPVVYIHPMSVGPYKNGLVAVPPFLVPANMDEEQALRIAGLFKDVLLGKRTFDKIKQIPDYYGTLPQAIEVGKKAGAELVLLGTVNYALAGTELGGARVEIAVRLLNVETGRTVWHIGQTMNQPMNYPDNGFLSRAMQSLSPPPIRGAAGDGAALTNMMAQIAVDVADVMGGATYVRR